MISGKCAICGKVASIDGPEGNPYATNYWKYKKFPNANKGIVFFCGSDHMLVYTVQTTADTELK